ncbi:GntR family transcriptional regulator [Kiloniella sp.]|uniref:GntR family transcriptional regulator n=1 Tax=Kiloniella sp. TaxID=1938587 RepID=UPI003B01C1CF
MTPTSSLQSIDLSARSGDQTRALITELREEIISGALRPGEPLRQDNIAERYKVSRMPVREALRVLEAEGLALLVPNKGASVAPLDPLELQEIYEMRVSAETLALRLSLPEISNAQIDRAARIQDDIENADLRDFGALNKAFHRTLYEPCGRRRLLTHIDGLNDVADRYLRFTIKALNYTERSNTDHYALLEACRTRDEIEATKILSSHISDAGETLKAYLNDFLVSEAKG